MLLATLDDDSGRLARLAALAADRVHFDAWAGQLPEGLELASATVARRLAAVSAFNPDAYWSSTCPPTRPCTSAGRGRPDASTLGLSAEHSPRMLALVALLLVDGLRISEARAWTSTTSATSTAVTASSACAARVGRTARAALPPTAPVSTSAVTRAICPPSPVASPQRRRRDVRPPGKVVAGVPVTGIARDATRAMLDGYPGEPPRRCASVSRLTCRSAAPSPCGRTPAARCGALRAPGRPLAHPAISVASGALSFHRRSTLGVRGRVRDLLRAGSVVDAGACGERGRVGLGCDARACWDEWLAVRECRRGRRRPGRGRPPTGGRDRAAAGPPHGGLRRPGQRVY